MNWTMIWMKLFGTTAWLGIDMGFWAALAGVALIVLLMNESWAADLQRQSRTRQSRLSACR